MKRLSMLAVALLALAGVFALGWRSHPSIGARVQAAQADNRGEVASGSPNNASGERGPVSSVADTLRLRELTEELHAKDQALNALAMARASAADRAGAREQAMEEAARVYEERLVASGTETVEARRNERSMRRLMDELLPPGSQGDLVCGATMCRMATYGVPLKLAPHLEAMVDRVAKDFGATRLLPKEDEVTVYFARTNDLLQIHPTPSTPIPSGGSENKTVVVAAGDEPAAQAGK